MNSNIEDYERYIDIIDRTLSEKNIKQQHFEIFQAALDSISKIYLEYPTSGDDIKNLQQVIRALKQFFKQDDASGLYTSVFERTERSRNALDWLKIAYNLKQRAKNTGKVLVSEDEVEPISLSNYTYPEGQSSLGVSNDEEEKQIIKPIKDKEDSEVPLKEECAYLSKGKEGKLDDSGKANLNETVNNFENTSGDTGGNHHIQRELISTMNSQLNDKEEQKEIAELKKEVEFKNQIISNLNIQLMQEATQNQCTKKHLNTVISQLEIRTTDARVHKEELAKKTREIESINKEITDLRKKNLTERSNREMLEYKVTHLQQVLLEKNEESKSFMTKLTIKDEQLKKMELEIETQRNIAVYETRQHQEKSKELQEFKSKSMELQSNLRAKGDELISKLRELSECKNDLKNYEELETKFKIESANYQKEITSLKDQLFSERKISRELSKQFESAKEQLMEQKESYNYLESNNLNLQSKHSKTVADLDKANTTVQNLEQEIKLTGERNSELNQKLESVNSQLQSVNNQLYSAEEQNKIVSNKLGQAEGQVKKMQKALDATEEELQIYNVKFCEEKDNNDKFNKTFEFYLSKLNKNRNELKAFIDELFRSQTIEEIREGERENVKKNALLQLDVIKSEIDGFREGVRQFSGNKTNKTFLNLQEMIQRCVEKIDQIQSQDISEIKTKKRDLIKFCAIVDGELQKKATLV